MPGRRRRLVALAVAIASTLTVSAGAAVTRPDVDHQVAASVARVSTRPADVAPAAVPADRVDPATPTPGVSLAPLPDRVQPDVFVHAPASLGTATLGRLQALVPAGHAVALRVGTLTLAQQQVSVAAADPAELRRFTPAGTAEVTAVWNAVADGGAAFSYASARRLGLALGGTVSGLRAAAFADTALPGIDMVVSNALGDRLGLAAPDAVVLAGSGGDPAVLADAAHAAITDVGGARVELLRQPAPPAVAFLSGGAAAKAFGSFTYRYYPDGRIVPDPAWVATNIVRARVPIIGWVTCHRLMIPQLSGALAQIEREGLADKIHPEQYEGCYVPKLIEDSHAISLHTWGIAVDLNVPTNQRGTHGDMDPRVVAIFKSWGFRWGGEFHTVPDPMHFELAALMGSPPNQSR